MGVHSQVSHSYHNSYDDSLLINGDPKTMMPYNRLISSAGKIITYGDPNLENHSLDLCALSKQFVVIEHRYGIAVMDKGNKKIIAEWSYSNEKGYQKFMSTYSGITSYAYENKTYISWGATETGNGKSGLMIAQWDGKNIRNVTSFLIDKKAPATLSLPNQIIANTENGELFLYAVLNGNDALLKIRFRDKKIIWTTTTGVAPYGACIVNQKIYVTNGAGMQVTDTTKEYAGTPWGKAYTNPTTGATNAGSLSVININDGLVLNEIELGLHPSAIIKSADNRFLYVTNGNSDNVSVIDVQKETVIRTIPVGLFAAYNKYYGSSPNALAIDSAGKTLYISNGLDYAVVVVALGKDASADGIGITKVKGYIPTEAYPGGLLLQHNQLYVANVDAKGSRVLLPPKELPSYKKYMQAYTIHKELASVSVIPVPDNTALKKYTLQVKAYNYAYRLLLTQLPARKNMIPVPVPERIGEPSVFKHVIYIIKENKTYDQVFGDIKNARGDERLCVFGEQVTPNEHQLANDFAIFDNYYVSGKSSAEGHQWADGAMISDYVAKNMNAWFRSYPHRQEDAMVYNKSGFIWNNALDHGKTVRVYGEACKTHFNNSYKWIDLYNKRMNHEYIALNNTTTIARLRPVIHARYPDCDNEILSDQLRADEFINDFASMEQKPGDVLPNLMVLSLPNDHTAGTSPDFPTPRAMVADNDLAVGRIVECVTHSRFWDSTVIFITEDDSQSGWDHISPYRSPFLLLSKYSVHNNVVHINYNQTSAVRTIEQILGIPPMNIIDATALPMFDCFHSMPQTYTYKVKGNNIPLNEMNKPLAELKGLAKFYARQSATNAFKEVDSGNDELMNKILWFYAKGQAPYPNNNQKNNH